jgi:hypothetical protein
VWTNETNPRLGLYNTKTKEWKFVFYPLEAVKSLFGGWVGLSDIAPVGGGNFLVVERDNQGECNRLALWMFGPRSRVVYVKLIMMVRPHFYCLPPGGPDAAIKKIFQVSLGDFSTIADGSTIEKKLVYDLMPLLTSLNGDVYEKIEGLCATSDGTVRNSKLLPHLVAWYQDATTRALLTRNAHLVHSSLFFYAPFRRR